MVRNQLFVSSSKEKKLSITNKNRNSSNTSYRNLYGIIELKNNNTTKKKPCWCLYSRRKFLIIVILVIGLVFRASVVYTTIDQQHRIYPYHKIVYPIIIPINENNNNRNRSKTNEASIIQQSTRIIETITNEHINNVAIIATKIGHVVSLITCTKKHRVRGFIDALMILRHSIHQNSIHGKTVGRRSKYSYQMIALIHANGGCTVHIELLRRIGYIPMVVNDPVNISSIIHPNGQYFKQHIENENCCGSKEFIKLYAYTLIDYPIIVYWDIDTVLLHPMDDLFDSMMYNSTTERGQTARNRIQIQRPMIQRSKLFNGSYTIDAFYTRDVTSSVPWNIGQVIQGGFLVVRPNINYFRLYQEIIYNASYYPGRGNGSGWGGYGYGGFQGAMAYQGIVAYFYDHILPSFQQQQQQHSTTITTSSIAIELDVCRWNQVVADIIWRGPTNMEYFGQCRQYPVPGVAFIDNTPENGYCEDCRIIPINEINTVHYTACKKPWGCQIPYPRIPRNKDHVYRLQQLTNITTCKLLFRKYFEYRNEIEDLIAMKLHQNRSIPNGAYHIDTFLGYCNPRGDYIAMNSIPEGFDMKEIYGF